MAQVTQVSSTEFADRFGQWSSAVQSAPVMVNDQKTGMVLGYFVSAADFEAYLRVRVLLPAARFAWEMPDDLASELGTPAGSLRPEHDGLMHE